MIISPEVSDLSWKAGCPFKFSNFSNKRSVGINRVTLPLHTAVLASHGVFNIKKENLIIWALRYVFPEKEYPNWIINLLLDGIELVEGVV